jgi:hypothetical protein
VLLPNEVLEIRNVDGGLHIARKERHSDESDPPVGAYDPYRPAMSSLMTDARCAATHHD